MMRATARETKPAFNRGRFEAAFRDFLAHVTILSKNEGYTTLNLYDLPWAPGWGCQERFLSQIFDGLEQDIHWFVCLKARQLGISTLSLCFDIFWLSFYPGLQGALVTDTDANKEKFRLIIGGNKKTEQRFKGIVDLLPESHRIPVVKNDRNGLVFENGSILDYLVAGTRKKTGSLGRSRAYNFVHGTELAQWADEEGLQSLISATSDTYPYRFYNWESTAKGYNHFNDMWEDAKSDDIAKKAIFLAWWMHPEYQVAEGARLFQRYGHKGLAEDERETQREVRKQFDYEITPEQWAWYRHRKDPQRRAMIGEIDQDAAEIIEVEFPSYPEEAFRLSGTPFFPGKALEVAGKRAEKARFKGFYYNFGESFSDMRRVPINNPRIAQLKIWEEPKATGVYIVAGDPSYGRGKDSDRHCAQICRCYADRIVQVGEFCAAQLPPFQFTWVLADLCGWYRNARWIIEIDGPGEAVMTEFRHLRTLLDTGQLNYNPDGLDEIAPPEDGRRRPRSPLQNVRDYLYHRPDALGGSYNIQWKTSSINKPVILTQLQDHFMMDHLIVNSVYCIYEMKKLVRIDTQIEADGNHKDDRPIALALGVRCWIDWERPELDAQGRTFAREQAQDDQIGDADTPGFMTYILGQRAAGRAAEQRRLQRAARRERWNW